MARCWYTIRNLICSKQRHCIEQTIPSGVHDHYRHIVRAWGERLAGNGTNIGYIPIKIWLGYRTDRRYMERWYDEIY
jgi:hypothetical protein